MSFRKWISLAVPAAILMAVLAGLLFWRVRAVQGVVLDENGSPVNGATVRLRASDFHSLTDASGFFKLDGFPPAFKVRLTAWADGYYVAGRVVWPWQRSVTLKVLPYTVPDNPSYTWIPASIESRSLLEEWSILLRLGPLAALAPDSLFFKAAGGLTLGCRDCHGKAVYDQWASGAHSLGLNNARFASMYNGTDITGFFQSPLTRHGYNPDYGSFPLLPDPSQPYYGPGYRLDFPASTGNCATCHLPAAALADPYATNPNTVTGVNALGSHCDFCHKIADVVIDPKTGVPYENMTGVLSLEMMRPSPEKQIFFGPYDDVDAGTDTNLPLYRQSRYCAACHNASFWGVPIYQSYAEWLASPYSLPSTGQTCQDCHMKPDGVATNFAPGRAGNERSVSEIFTHSFPGASRVELLQNSVSMSLSTRREGDRLIVDVSIVNDRTGHSVPTDSPLRQMILLVKVRDADGNLPSQIEGPVIPDYGGIGDPREGYYAGMPGKIYAKILAELWTEASPSGAYWNPTRILSDNRIPALGKDSSSYVFEVPADVEATVEASLFFRRAFKQLMDQKNWDDADILMAQQTMVVR